MRRLIAVLGLLFSVGAHGAVLRSAAELANAVFERNAKDLDFEIEAVVTFTPKATGSMFGIRDESGAMLLYNGPEISHTTISPGDRILARGKTSTIDSSENVFANCTSFEVLGHDESIETSPATVSAADLQSGRHDCTVRTLLGTVRDAFMDDVDPEWTYLVVESGTDEIYAPVRTDDRKGLESLIGSEISLTGVCMPSDTGSRMRLGRIFRVADQANVRIIRGRKSDPFDTPLLDNVGLKRPSEIARIGRRRVIGHVIATWRGKRALIRLDTGDCVRIDIASQPIPRCGDRVEAVGFPETDLYRISLSRATWRKAGGDKAPEDRPEAISVAALFMDEHGRPRFDPKFCNRLIRTDGTVKSVTVNNGTASLIYIEESGCVMAVDASTLDDPLPDIRPGCRLAITGICVMDTEYWRPNSVFPRINGLTLVVRHPEDLTVLAHPPWWTTTRLMAVIGAMLTVLIGIIIWNRSLNRIAERRGRELLREQIGHIKANLKVDERTRLAVDLHDALSQSLTGIAMQIDLVKRLTSDENCPKIDQHLNIASRTLQSCRNELRSCIWDLRNQALDEPAMENAIRMTLLPHLDATRLAVRFPVSRARLNDNTAHTILRIVRELVSNAIRHGHAASVRVAGAVEADRLSLSVQDDGTGFDPSSRPSIREGHFGLDGIKERIRSFSGNMEIASNPGHGTKITVTLILPRPVRKDPASNA